MVNRFLKAKHWQLFLLIIGLPMIAQIVFLSSIFINIGAEQPNIGSAIPFFVLFPILMITMVGILFGWYWSVGAGLQRIIPDELKMRVSMFRFFLIFPVIYIFLMLGVMGYMITSAMASYAAEPPFIFLLIVPMHLFAMFCIFYCMYFVAKTIKTAELKRKVGFGDYAGEFFLIWFYPIGIWFIQPKVNQLIERKEDIVE